MCSGADKTSVVLKLELQAASERDARCVKAQISGPGSPSFFSVGLGWSLLHFAFLTSLRQWFSARETLSSKGHMTVSRDTFFKTIFYLFFAAVLGSQQN